MVGRDIFTYYSIKMGVNMDSLLTIGLVTRILLLLLRDAARLLYSISCVSSRWLFFTVSSSLSRATTTSYSLGSLTRRLVSHLMIVHPH